MEIAIVIPTLNQGGAERVVSILANNWSLKHNVTIILLAETDNFYEVNSNVTIKNLGYKITKNKFSKIFKEISLFFKLRKELKKKNNDFTLSFMNKYNIFTLIAALGLNKRIIISERDGPSEKLPFKTTFLRNLTYRFAYGVICQTQQSKIFIENKTKNKNVTNIPNPINTIEFSLKKNRENIILNVGRLVEKKGQKYLIECFSKIKNDNWKVVILGDGPLKNELLNLIKELNLEDKVFLMGAVKNVEEWLFKSSIFVFPSILEGFPNALAEAMCCGLPSISFNCDAGPSDIIKNNKNGFLVDVYDTVNLQNKIELLMNDSNLREEFSKESKKLIDALDSKKVSQLYLSFCSKGII